MSDNRDFSLTYTHLPSDFYAEHTPVAVANPRIVLFNHDLAAALDLTWSNDLDTAQMLSGSRAPEDIKPVAMAYCGHQFGHWSGMLGDGRAALFAEIVSPDGQRFDLHLKGSGRTPYSRGGDGKATVGAVVREFLIGEAMHGLGIPTTRALAVTTTGEQVIRQEAEPGAVLSRIAKGHIRVGTFQMAAASEDSSDVKSLADYAMARFYPELTEGDYLGLLKVVVNAQANLIARWMQVGFIHGVMNTDNMSISAETIDFGPCAFMDGFHPAKVFSSIDHQGRYAWNNQPNIGLWNLTRLAECLVPLIDDDKDEAIERAQAVLATFSATFADAFYRGFADKLGFDYQGESDHSFIDETFAMLTQGKVDFTLFFRHLTRVAAGHGEADLASQCQDSDSFTTWLSAWQTKRQAQSASAAERLDTMNRVNPVYIPRNHRVEEAILAAEKGDFSLCEALLTALRSPFTEHPDLNHLEMPPAPAEEVRQTFCGT